MPRLQALTPFKKTATIIISGKVAYAMMEDLTRRGTEPTTPGCEPDACVHSASNWSNLLDAYIQCWSPESLRIKIKYNNKMETYCIQKSHSLISKICVFVCCISICYLSLIRC